MTDAATQFLHQCGCVRAEVRLRLHATQTASDIEKRRTLGYRLSWLGSRGCATLLTLGQRCPQPCHLRRIAEFSLLQCGVDVCYAGDVDR